MKNKLPLAYEDLGERQLKNVAGPIGAALAHLDWMEEARNAVALALEALPDLTLSFVADTLPTKEPRGLDPYLEGLGKAGLPR